MPGPVGDKRAVVFDLDGTLIDSLPDLAAALNRSLARHAQAAIEAEQVKPMVGDGALMLLQRGYSARGLTPSQADTDIFLADYQAHVTDLTSVYPGIQALLSTLTAQGDALAVCTNKPEASARKVLAALNLLTFFPVVIGGDTTPFRKPDPRHLQAVLDAIGASPAHAVMIGDHPNDLATAAGCGAAGIFCAWGYGHSDAPHRADSPAQLGPLITHLLPPQ